MTSLADPAANIIFGAVVDDRYTGAVNVTIIATGFSQTFQKSLVDGKASRQDLQESRSELPWKRTAPLSTRLSPGGRGIF